MSQKKMRTILYMKAVLLKSPVFLGLMFFLTLSFCPVVAQTSEPVSFSWAVFLRSPEEEVKRLDFGGPEHVAAGDLLRIYLRLHQKSMVYLYLYDSMGDLYLVFPPDPTFYKGGFQAWKDYYIPSDRGWFALDESKGVERFFLLASNDRQEDLEELTNKFLVSNHNPELKGKLLALIEKRAEVFSTPGNVDVEPVPVSHNSSMSIPVGTPGVTALKTSASGNYSLTLDLVNR